MRALSPAEELALDAAPRWATRRPPPGPQPSCGPDLRLHTWDLYANLAPPRPLSYSFPTSGRRAGKASIAAAVERLLAEGRVTTRRAPFQETLELADEVGLRLDAWQAAMLEAVLDRDRASFDRLRRWLAEVPPERHVTFTHHEPRQNGRAAIHLEGPGWWVDGWHDPSAGSR